MEPVPPNPTPAPALQTEEEKNRLEEELKAKKAERMAKMKNKMVKGEIKEFVPLWISDPTAFEGTTEGSPNTQTTLYTPEEQALLASLQPTDKILPRILALLIESNPAEIDRLYTEEKANSDFMFERIKKVIEKNSESVLAIRRGPIIGIGNVALDKGLKIEDVSKFFRQLTEEECLEILYAFMLHRKKKLYPNDAANLNAPPQQIREQAKSRANKWNDFMKSFFYDNVSNLDHIWATLEAHAEEVNRRLAQEPEEPVRRVRAEREKQEVVEQEEVVDTAALTKANKEKVKIFNETKEPMVMIFIGHVDAGKSTICGSILNLTGTVSELEMNKLKQEAKGKGMEGWYNAYVMDVIEEEKDTGKTIEMGRAYFETALKRFTILDCPGHKNFVQAMLGGAAQADVASLVISAKLGEFESGFEKEGQTREHAMLARSLGAQYLVVLINKMDTVAWSEDRYKYIRTNLTPFLELNCGFDRSKIFWTICSGLQHHNLAQPIASGMAPWFKGDTVFKTFDSLPPLQRSTNPILRIPLLDKFRDMGAIITSCKINSGIVRPNMQCTLMPLQKSITIAKVMDTADVELAYAGTGESVTLHLKGIEEDDIRRGYVICGKQFFSSLCFEFIAEVTVFELLPYHCFGPGFTCMMHLHTALEEVQILSLERLEESESGLKKVEAKVLRSGQRGIVKFKSRNLLCLEKYEEFQEMGRFCLRKETITLGSGTIQKYKPAKPELLKNNNYFGRKEEPKAEVKEEAALTPEETKPEPTREYVSPAPPKMDDGEDI